MRLERQGRLVKALGCRSYIMVELECVLWAPLVSFVQYSSKRFLMMRILGRGGAVCVHISSAISQSLQDLGKATFRIGQLAQYYDK